MKTNWVGWVAIVLGVTAACSSDPSDVGGDAGGGAAGEASGGVAGSSSAAGSHAGAVAGSAADGGGFEGGAAGMETAGAVSGGGKSGTAAGGGAGVESGAGGESGAAGVHSIPQRRTWNGTLPQKGVCSIHGWCWAGPLPAANAMNDVWGSSASDVWAIGEAGTVMHFDGADWTGVTGIGTDVQWGDDYGASWLRVHGSGPSDAWFLGETKQVLHWNGTKLQEGAYGGNITPRAVWAATPQAAWLVGDAGAMSRWNGTTWTDGSTGTGQNLKAVWGFADNDVWAAGGSVVRHWTGSAWEDRSTGLPGDAGIVAIWGASTTDVWAVGARAYRYQAGSWTMVWDTPFVDVAGSSANEVVLLSDLDSEIFRGGDNWDYGNAGGLNETAAWAVGASDFFVTAQGDWEVRPNAPEQNVWCRLGRGGLTSDEPVVEVGHGDWGMTHAVSPNMLLQAWDEDSLPLQPWDPTLRRFDGTAYTDIDTKVSKIRYVSGDQEDDVWVSTDDGQTSHFDGQDWTVYGISDQPIAAVSVRANEPPRTFSGKILYAFDGNAWTPEHTFDQGIISHVVGPSTVWVTSWDGAVWQGAGSSWKPLREPYPGIQPYLVIINELGLDDSGRLWQVFGTNKTTLVSYWDGTWHDSGTLPVGAVDMEVRGNEIWVLNQVGAAYRFDGNQWVTYRTGKDALFDGISIAGPGDVWAFGAGGMLHYTDP